MTNMRNPKARPAASRRGSGANRPATKGSPLDRALRLLRARSTTFKVRMDTAIALLRSPPAAEEARRALERLLKKASEVRFVAKISKVLLRYEASLPPVVKIDRASAVTASIDLSGPRTMAILVDPELRERWKTLHWNDPSEVWLRRLAAISPHIRERMSYHDIAAIERLAVEQRAGALDTLMARAESATLGPSAKPGPPLRIVRGGDQ